MMTSLWQYSLGYDCPVFPGLFSYVCYVTGASLTMADCLIFNKSRVAINWYGGWHHGKKLALICILIDITCSVEMKQVDSVIVMI